MGLFKSWAEWIVDAQNTARSFDQDVGNVVVGQACNIYNRYGGLLPNLPFQRARLQSLCEVNQTPIVAPNFPAPYAQCPGDRYRMIFREYKSLNGVLPAEVGLRDNESRWSVILTAPIVSVDAIRNGNVIDSGYIDFPDPTFRTNTNVVRVVHAGGTVTSDFNLGSSFGIKVIRFDPNNEGIDGLCDEENPQVVPDDLTSDVTINNYNSEGDVISTHNIPLVFAPINNVLSLPIAIDFGGTTIILTEDGYGTPDGIEESEDEAQEQPFNTFNFNQEDIILVEEQAEEEDVSVEYLTVTVTTPPCSGRTYVSSNPDNVHFNAAYLRWTGTGGGAEFDFPDIPIRRLKTLHRRPDDAGGYKIYAVNGASIAVTKFMKQAEEEE